MTSRAVQEPPETKSTSTPWAWLLALTPVVSALAVQPALIGFQQAAASPIGGRVPQRAADLIAVGFVIDLTVAILLIGVSGLLARLDQRELRRRRIDRPFPWGWGFLSAVYLIGRTVVLHHRTGRGAAPLVLAVALFISVMLVLFIEFGVVFAIALQNGAVPG